MNSTKGKAKCEKRAKWCEANGHPAAHNDASSYCECGKIYKGVVIGAAGR